MIFPPKKDYLKIDTLKILGIFFLLVWLIDFLTKWHWFGLESFQFLFFCSILLLFGGLGLLFKIPDLIAGTLGLVLIFQIPWFLDMLAIIFLDKSINHSASYVFDINKWQYLITLRHFFMIPVLFYGLSYFNKINKYIASFLAVSIFSLIVGITFLFAPVSEDINYFISSGYKFTFLGGPILNRIVIFLAINILAFFVTFILSRIPFENDKAIKNIRRFSIVYIIAGIILSVWGFISIF